MQDVVPSEIPHIMPYLGFCLFSSLSKHEDILGHAAAIRGFKTSLLVGESSVKEASDDLWCFCPSLSSRKLFKKVDK